MRKGLIMFKKLTKAAARASLAGMLAMGGVLAPSVAGALQTEAAASGWVKESGSWYYYQNGTALKNQWFKDSDGLWYHFDNAGKMQTGWIKDGYKYYYLQKGGSMAKSRWCQVGDDWYWMQQDGSMATNRWIKTNGAYYYLNGAGRMETNADIGGQYLVNGDGCWFATSQDGGYVLDSGDSKVADSYDYMSFFVAYFSIDHYVPVGIMNQSQEEWIADLESQIAALENTMSAEDVEMVRLQSLGFFKANGWYNVEDMMTSETINDYEWSRDGKILGDYTQLGVETDATSLANMETALDYIKSYNKDYRKVLGLSELKINDYHMLAAQMHVNCASEIMGHPGAFGVNENLAFYSLDPLGLWYSEIDNVISGSGETGHYRNMVNTGVTVTGFAINSGTTTTGQVWCGDRSGVDNAPDCAFKSYSYEEYRAKFDAYYSAYKAKGLEEKGDHISELTSTLELVKNM